MNGKLNCSAAKDIFSYEDKFCIKFKKFKKFAKKLLHSKSKSANIISCRSGGKADALDSGSSARKGVWVQLPSSALFFYPKDNIKMPGIQ